jgi:hypothetical protein
MYTLISIDISHVFLRIWILAGLPHGACLIRIIGILKYCLRIPLHSCLEETSIWSNLLLKLVCLSLLEDLDLFTFSYVLVWLKSLGILHKHSVALLFGDDFYLVKPFVRIPLSFHWYQTLVNPIVFKRTWHSESCFLHISLFWESHKSKRL